MNATCLRQGAPHRRVLFSRSFFGSLLRTRNEDAGEGAFFMAAKRKNGTNVELMYSPRDIRESMLASIDRDLLNILLIDHSTGKNIRWCTDYYSGHLPNESIEAEDIIGLNEEVIRPRVDKSREEQRMRSKERAEVFTPAWVCNAQNNLIDEAWFGRPNVFNSPTGDANWTPSTHIYFPKGKTWQDYVLAKRLEVSCGEAPYLTSRFDVVNGAPCPFYARIGILDRKLRVLEEVYNEKKKSRTGRWKRREWFRWAEYALKSTYGFDWQGDNVLIAREHLLFAVVDAHKHLFPKLPLEIEQLIRFAEIISWNIWQMDGIKCVVPETCHDEIVRKEREGELFQNEECEVLEIKQPCPGCKKKEIKTHNGIVCLIMDWACNTPGKKDTPIPFRDLIK